MGFRFQLPHLSCMGYSAPRPGGRSVDYQRDPRNPGSVVISDPRVAKIAGLALGQTPIEEGSIVRLHTETSAESWECACGRANWAWVEVCPICSCHRDSGRAA